MSEAQPRIHTLLWVISGVLVAVLGLSVLKAWSDLQSVQRHEAEVESQIDEARQRVERLEGRIESLREDDVALEHVAREQLGLAREGEVVIVLPEQESVLPPPD